MPHSPGDQPRNLSSKIEIISGSNENRKYFPKAPALFPAKKFSCLQQIEFTLGQVLMKRNLEEIIALK